MCPFTNWKERLVVPKWCPTVQNHLLKSSAMKNRHMRKFPFYAAFKAMLWEVTPTYAALFWFWVIKNARDCFRSILKTVPLLVLNAYNFERIRYRCFIFLHKMKQLCSILRAPHVGNSGKSGILSAMQCNDASIPYKEVGRRLIHDSVRKIIMVWSLIFHSGHGKIEAK